jgi:hypothetical protein
MPILPLDYEPFSAGRDAAYEDGIALSGRRHKILCPRCVVGIERDHHLVFVIGRAEDVWIG